MPTVTCPSCGNADDLEGRRSHDAVTIHCGACGNTWERDLTPTCTLCGSTDLVAIPTSTLEEAGRGDQRTPSGIRDIYRCSDCGARNATSASPVVDADRERRQAGPLKVVRTRDDDLDLPQPVRSGGAARRVESDFGTFAPGEVIGERWRLQRLLRWSSTGSLWLAHADGGDQRVVFKLVHPQLTNDARLTALYASAAHALVGVRHPHLAPILDVKVAGGHVLIVIPAIEGSVLTPGSRPSPETFVSIAHDIAGALAAMHERQVTHLDIRPERILLDRDGQARLIDLGSGRARAANPTRVAGSDRMAFQAPEQILSRTHAPPADVYSLGLTLWTLAGGDLQQMGVNPSAQASYRMTNHVPALDPAATQLPTHIVEAIAAATRRPVDQRPTAATFAARLRHSG